MKMIINDWLVQKLLILLVSKTFSILHLYLFDAEEWGGGEVIAHQKNFAQIVFLWFHFSFPAFPCRNIHDEKVFKRSQVPRSWIREDFFFVIFRELYILHKVNQLPSGRKTCSITLKNLINSSIMFAHIITCYGITIKTGQNQYTPILIFKVNVVWYFFSG